MGRTWWPKFSLWNCLFFITVIAVSIRIGYVVGFEHGRMFGFQQAPVQSRSSQLLDQMFRYKQTPQPK